MLISQVVQNAKVDQVEIEIFLSNLLGKDRSFIKAFPEFKLKKEQIEKLKEFLKRRVKNEPLAYILGHKEFCGLIFKVNPRVMIPRSETEELVTEVIKHVYRLPSRSKSNHLGVEPLTIVDVGTGCGNIATSLALAAPFAKIFAIEKDAAAFKVAKENIKNHRVEENVELIKGDLLEPIRQSVDIIVANLPYIPSSRFAGLAPEVTDWEPRGALDGGRDGLEVYRRLFQQAPNILKPSGRLFYELDGQVYRNKRIS